MLGLGRVLVERGGLRGVRVALLALGIVSFTAGAAILVVGVFGLLDGGSGRPQLQVVDLGPTAVPATPDPTAAPTPGPPPLGDQPYNMVIEKLGVDAPVRTYGIDPATKDTEPTPEVPTGADAAQIVAWYDFSAKPGSGGNAIFAGHVTWFGAAVFYSLDQTQAGDLIKLRGQDGTEVAYKVSSVFEVDPSNPNSTQVMAQTEEDVITIITCGGSFVDTNDPVFGGDYTNRLVVRGSLLTVSRPPVVAAGG